MRSVRGVGRRLLLEPGDGREVVLVRYSGGGGGGAGTPEEVVEGYIRPTPVGPILALEGVSRRDMPKMTPLSHVDGAGKARMVDVTGKATTRRFARAQGSIRMTGEALEAIRSNAVAKGDVLGVARVAGIAAAKKTADLVPLCHQVPLTNVEVDFELDDSLPGVRVVASATTQGQTGVEMEAITAVSVSLITLYDMVKGVDKAMVIGDISLLEKRGGKSGDWIRGKR